MNKAYRTNVTVLLLIIHQLVISFFWYFIVQAFHLSTLSQLFLTQIVCFMIPLLIYFAVTKESVKKTLRLNPLGFKNILLILLIMIFIQPAVSFLSALTSLFFPNNVSAVLSDINSAPLMLIVFTMAVTPAVCEECFFRGIVFSGYENVNIVKACITAGLMFGIMHMDGQQFLYAFFMGALFCYFVYKTKSIFSSMLAHFFLNGSQVVLSRFSYEEAARQGADILSQTISTQDMIVALIITLAVTVFTIPILFLLFLLFERVNKRQHNPVDGIEIVTEDILAYHPPKGCEQRVANLPFFLIIGIYLLVVVFIPVFLVFFL